MPKVFKVQAPDYNGFTFYGQSGNDTLTGGVGDQQFLYGTKGDDLITGGVGVQGLYGGSDLDTIIGGTGNQSLYGGSDQDTIVAGVGNQTLDGGSGLDTLDFSKVTGTLDIDLDLKVATIADANGVIVNTYYAISFDTIIGTNQGNTFDGAQYTPRNFIGGAGADHFHSESGGDTMVGGAGADDFRWYKIYVAVNHTDEIKDFQVGTDHLNMADFLKGQYTLDGAYIKLPGYAQVMQLAAASDAAGHASTMVQALAGDGIWHNVVLLDGVDASTVTINDLVL